jgi:hypothetical protein
MATAARISVPLEAIRTLAIVRQGLDRRPDAASQEAMLGIIQRIGALQLDSVNVVARSHYLVMLSRLGLYDRGELDALLYPQRHLFEQWAHAACLLPVEDFAYLAPAISARRRQPMSSWQRESLGSDPEALLERVLAEIRERGPLTSRDFEDTREGREPWWGFKPAKHALAYQFRQGYLLVDRRVNFQIYYDLAERVMPNHQDQPARSLKEYHRWAVLRGLSCLGVATASQVCDYYRLSVRTARDTLGSLENEGEVLLAEVPGWKEPAYARPETLPELERIARGEVKCDVTTFLSPFDNLIWDRKRVKMLFDFDYTIEIYVPPLKRVYGYYVMPILHHGRLVGRLDAKADRQEGTLLARHLYLERAEQVDMELVAGLSNALKEFMAFHRCQAIRIEHAEPEELKSALRDELREVIVE